MGERKMRLILVPDAHNCIRTGGKVEHADGARIASVPARERFRRLRRIGRFGHALPRRLVGVYCRWCKGKYPFQPS